MKKVMFVVLSLLIASACFALESGPSNKVGYTKITCGGNGFTPFGIAFKTWQVPVGGIPTYGTPGNRPSDIVGDQANCGTAANADRVISQGVGSAFAFRNSAAACAWQNTLETAAGMTASKAYWYRNFQATARDIVIAGEADITTLPPSVTISAGSQPVPAYIPYSWRDPRSRSRDNLQVVVAGMHCGTAANGDRIIDQTPGGSFAIRVCPSSWFGTMLTVEPGRAYWIQNRGAAYAYQYDPTSSATLSMPGGSKGSASVDVLKNNNTKTISKTSGATN